MVEVDSLNNQYDKYRLYVQMACALKLALAFRPNAVDDDKFFLMGAFFAKDREIYRIFFYKKADKVRLKTSTWIGSTSHHLFPRFAFTRECLG